MMAHPHPPLRLHASGTDRRERHCGDHPGRSDRGGPMVDRGQQQARATAAAVNPARDGIVQLLRTDLANSRRLWPYPDGSGVALSGYAGLAPGTLDRSGDLCRVYYRLVNGVLVRVQEPLDRTANRTSWSEIVCSDVVRFALTPIPDTDELPAQPEDVRGGQPLPGRVTLVIQSRDPANSISEDLWLR